MAYTFNVFASPAPAPIPAAAKQTLSGLNPLRATRDGRLAIAPMQAVMDF